MERRSAWLLILGVVVFAGLAFSAATDETWAGAYRWAALIAGALLTVLCLVGLSIEVSRLISDRRGRRGQQGG
jgi:hypothetical protein